MDWHDPPADVFTEWQSATKAAFDGQRTIDCPTGDGQRLRYFFYRHSEPPRARGGFWIWCPTCHAYEHASATVPEWWQDISVPLDELTHDPGWLDENWNERWLSA